MYLVAAAVARLREVAGLLEVGDELCCGAVSDSNGHGDVSEAGFWFGGEVGEHARVVGDEAPAAIEVVGVQRGRRLRAG